MNILSLKTTRKIGNVISFLPLIISYLFGFSYLYTNLGNIGLGSPFVNIAMLSYYAYMNQDPPLYLIGNVNSSISPVLPLIVLISWIGLLSVLALMFIRNLYLKPLEEGRSI
ncbi:hypothetical protein [Sulfolobus acidocaldarius]|uniref:hypothetical protein n=1 Tax=Sulfolobus acidocaldarius TaxID=2285 RepID=UPI000A6F8817|nr:hypothetical protein [Sulfolobus acidocaldarius]